MGLPEQLETGARGVAVGTLVQLVLHREAPGSVRSYIVERSRRRLQLGLPEQLERAARGGSSPGPWWNLLCTVRGHYLPLLHCRKVRNKRSLQLDYQNS